VYTKINTTFISTIETNDSIVDVKPCENEHLFIKGLINMRSIFIIFINLYNVIHGGIGVYQHKDNIYPLKGIGFAVIQCSTNFTARTQEFITFCHYAAKYVYAAHAKDWKTLINIYPEAEETRVQLCLKLKEDITFLYGRALSLHDWPIRYGYVSIAGYISDIINYDMVEEAVELLTEDIENTVKGSSTYDYIVTFPDPMLTEDDVSELLRHDKEKEGE
jgi:hypothetical protein